MKYSPVGQLAAEDLNEIETLFLETALELDTWERAAAFLGGRLKMIPGDNTLFS